MDQGQRRFSYYGFRTIIVLFLSIFSVFGLKGQAALQNPKDGATSPITNYPYICGFEEDVFPPPGWAHCVSITNPSNWVKTNENNSQGIAPHRGNSMICAPINCTNAGLSMPVLQLAYPNHYYQIHFWIYRYMNEQTSSMPSVQFKIGTEFNYYDNPWYSEPFAHIGDDNGVSQFFGQHSYNWLISPQIDLGEPGHDYQLSFMYALTHNYQTPLNGQMDEDDIFAIWLSTSGDDFHPDHLLAQWDSDNPLASSIDQIELDLSAYSGLVRIGFYAASEIGAWTPAKKLHLDNVSVFEGGAMLPPPILIQPVGDNIDLDPVFQWVTTGGNPDGYRLLLKQEDGNWEVIAEGDFTSLPALMPLAYACDYSWKVQAYRGELTVESEVMQFTTREAYGYQELPHGHDFSSWLPKYYGNFKISNDTGQDSRNSGRLKVDAENPTALLRTCLIEFNSSTRYSYHFRLFQNPDAPIAYELQEGDMIELLVSHDRGRSYHAYEPRLDWNASPGSYAYQSYLLAFPENQPLPQTQMMLIRLSSGGNSFYMDLDWPRATVFTAGSSVVTDPEELSFDTINLGLGMISSRHLLLSADSGYLEIIHPFVFIGEDAGDFEIRDHIRYPICLGPAQDFTLQVYFSPATDGEKSAALRITDEGGHEYFVGITGKAIGKTELHPPIYLDFDGPEQELEGWWAGKMDDDIDPNWVMGQDLLNPDNQLLSIAGDSPPNYIVSPAVTLEAGQQYDFMFNYRNTTGGTQLGFQVLCLDALGDEPSICSEIAISGVTGAVWRVARLSFIPDESKEYYFGVVTSQSAGNGILYIDNIRIMPMGNDKARIFASVSEGGVCALEPSPLWHPIKEAAHYPSATITGLVATGRAESVFEWNPPEVGYAESGLSVLLRVETGSLGGTTLRINHLLGFVPHHIGLRAGDGDFVLINNPVNESWTAEYMDYIFPTAKGTEEYQFIFPKTENATLPVIFSAFHAAAIPKGKIKVEWTTESETALRGYYLFRADALNLVNAIQISLLIPAHNSSQHQEYSFIDAELEAAGGYYYWLRCEGLDGSVSYHGPCSAILSDQDFPNTPDIPLITELGNPYPNPFNPLAFINYSITKESLVNLEVYNIKGQKVATLVNEKMPAGRYQYIWDGKAQNGQLVSSGIYLLRMKAGDYVKRVKMVMSK